MNELLKRKWVRLSALVLSGALTALAVSVPKVGLLAWVSSVPAFLVLLSLSGEGVRAGRAYLFGLVFFETYFFGVYRWVFAMYPMEFLGISRGAAVGVVILAWVGLSLLSALLYALIFPVCTLFSRSALLKKRPLLLPFLFSALWTVAEWGTTQTFLGVPWGRIALSQTDSVIFLQSASLFGGYFVSLLLVLFGTLAAFALYTGRVRLLILPVSLFAINLALGGILMSAYRPSDKTLLVAAVQGNVSSAEKWDPDRYVDMLGRLIDLSLEAGDGGAEIILWSESTVPDTLREMPSTLSLLSKLAKKDDALLFVGGFEEKDGKKYNTLFMFDREGNLSDEGYYKRHLVPFGEYLPMKGLVSLFAPRLADMNALGDDLTAGEGAMLFETGYGKMGTLICFDSIYEELARESVKAGAELLLLPTNDSWFEGSSALKMHEGQAVLRAVENRRSILRAANSGISSVIDPLGRVQASLGGGEEGVLEGESEVRSDLTLYTRTGNLILWLSAAFVLGTAVLAASRKQRRMTKIT